MISWRDSRAFSYRAGICAQGLQIDAVDKCQEKESFNFPCAAADDEQLCSLVCAEGWIWTQNPCMVSVWSQHQASSLQGHGPGAAPGGWRQAHRGDPQVFSPRKATHRILIGAKECHKYLPNLTSPPSPRCWMCSACSACSRTSTSGKALQHRLPQVLLYFSVLLQALINVLMQNMLENCVRRDCQPNQKKSRRCL